MNTLLLVDTKEAIGSVTDEELGQLIDLLEEESEEDQDYYIDADTLVYLEESQVSPSLIALLKKALGDKESVDIQWVKE